MMPFDHGGSTKVAATRSLTPDQIATLKAAKDMSDRLEAEVGCPFNNLSDWLADEYSRRVEGKFYQHFFEPRKLAPPGGYHSPKNVAATLVCHFVNMAMEEDIDFPIVETEIQATAVYYEVLRYKVPIYYVADSFIRAVAATELPSDFTLHDLHWPMPGIVLGFPFKFMREYLGCDACYVYCADLEEGIHPAPEFLRTIPWASDARILATSAKVAVVFNYWDKKTMASLVSAYLKSDRVDEAMTKYTYTDFTFADAASVAEDKKRIMLMSSLVFKLLVVLNTRPALADCGSVQRPEKCHHKTGEIVQTELWSANIIGANYRMLRQATPAGTHASPRFHFRRGHLTHQRIGSSKQADFVRIGALPRREDGDIDWLATTEDTRQAFWRCHRRLWVEPCLINFEENDQPQT